jgi:hypothetical protein
MMEPFFLVFVFILPAFTLPVIIGPILLLKFRDELGKMAAWFTLKPLLATPLWIVSLFMIDSSSSLNPKILQTLTMLPAILLTLLLVLRFRKVIPMESKSAAVLIILDALRWLNTYIWLATGGKPYLQDPFLLAGWILPNLYAVIALVIMGMRKRKQAVIYNEDIS